MGADIRRRAMMKYLCKVRYATITNLSEIFSVSERTIRRDIEILSLREPIYTKPGRYEGGVYVMDGYYIEQIYFTKEENEIMQKLFDFASLHRGEVLSDQEIAVFKNMLEIHKKDEKQN